MGLKRCFEGENKRNLGLVATIFIFAFVALFYYLAFNSSYASSVAPNNITGDYIYYTNKPTDAILPLEDEAGSDEAIAVFSTTGSAFYFASYNGIEPGSTATEIDSIGWVTDKETGSTTLSSVEWIPGEQNYYYVTITERDEEYIRYFDGVSGDPNLLKRRGRTLKLQQICVIYDDDNPVIDNVSVISNVTMKSTDELVLSFDISDGISGIRDEAIVASINGKRADTVAKIGEISYEAVFPMHLFTEGLDNGESFPTMNLLIEVEDKAGNLSSYAQTIDDMKYDCLEITNVTMGSSNERTGLAKRGDTVTLSFETSIELDTEAFTNAKAAENDMELHKLEDNGKKWLAQYTITEEDEIIDNSVITAAITIENNGIIKSITQEDAPASVVFYDEIGIKSLQFTSSNEIDAAFAIRGDTITVKYETTHPVIISNTKISGNYVWFQNSCDGMIWTASYTIPNDISMVDGSDFTFEFMVSDEAGNPTITITQEDTNDKIKFGDDVDIINLRVISNNPQSTGYVRVGNTVTITFATQKSVLMWPWSFPYNMIHFFTSSTIANRSIEFENVEGDGMHWKGEVEITPEMGLIDGEKVPFFFQVIGDGLYNDRNQNSTSGVIYYNDIELRNLEFKSSNYNPKLAKDGDTITVSFNTNHRVSIKEATIAGEAVALTSRDNNGKDWTGIYTVENGKLEDNSDIYFELSVEDNAGHTKIVTQNENDCIRYLAPLEVTNLSMVSSNADPTLAKDNDAITVSFETQHTISRYDVAIADKRIDLTNGYANGKWRWTGSYVVEDGDIEDLAMLALELKIYDASGNSVHITQDDLETGVQYYAPIKITDFSLLSNNSNTSLAKDADVISTAFRTQHPVTITKSIFAGKEAILESINEDGMTWNGSYTVAGGDTEDEGIIAFDCYVSDKAGNIAEITEADSNNSIRYQAPIEILDLKIASSNEISSLAKVGDLITVSFSTQHKVNIGNAKIALHDVKFTSENDAGMVWTGTYRINEAIIADGSIIDFAFAATDDAGNAAVRTQADIEDMVTYFGPIQINDLNFTSSNSSKRLVKVGNTLTLSFRTQHEVRIKSARIGSKNVSFTSENNEGKMWSATINVDNGFVNENSNVPFSLEIDDVCGNTAKASHLDILSIKYYAPIGEGFSGLSFASDNSSPGIAKDGDTVVVRFNTTHPTVVSNGYIGGRSVSFNSDNDMEWYASMRVANGQISDNSSISFSFSISDAAGNVTVSKNQSDSSRIMYQAPIDEALSGVSLVSDNITSKSYAKNGNTISLSFNTSHPVSVSNGSIAGKTVTFSSTDDMHWSASYLVRDGEITDNTDIKCSFTLSDAAGNPSVTRNQDHIAKVRYQAPIKINQLSMVSNNMENLKEVARDGDTIYLSFNTTHPVMLSSTKIADQYVSCKSLNDDNMHWSAEYTVINGQIEDNQNVALYFVASDMAGNAPVTITQKDALSGRIVYYSPIVISDLEITTNNDNDGRMYAKDGDTVTVKFTTNHDVTLSNTYVTGKKAIVEDYPNAENDTARDWVLSYKLQNGDASDLAEVTFNFDVDDIAGNNQVKKKNTDSDVTNKIQYYAPLEAETTMTSNGNNAYFAKNGDSVTVRSSTSHDAFVVESKVFARPTSNSGINSKNIEMTYTFPENETVLTEGPVPFEYILADLAGNTISISDSTYVLPQVIYDRTNPVVSAVPDFSGFTNQMLSFKITYRDTNIDTQGVSLKVNGVEQITAANRNSISGTEFVKEVVLDIDGEYLIAASMVDKASNKSNPDVKSDITVDTTNPEIKHVKLELGAPRTYKAGFDISEYFSINEKYIKEVICTVADNYGVAEWDIYTPITTDGKKTIYLMVTDMSGNNSAELTYDLYLDGTPPKPIVMETYSGTELLPDAEAVTFVSDLSFRISLDKLHIGDEEPDRFTELKLLDKNKNLVADLLGTVTPTQDGVYTYTLENFGEYTFVLSTADSVGNVIEACEYSFIYKDKTIFQKYFDNKPVLYSSSAGAGVLAIGSIVFISIRRRRKK